MARPDSMSSRSSDASGDEERRRPGCGGLLVLPALAILLYVAVLILARTPGGRSLVADRLGTRLGFPVEIGEMGLSPTFVLELRKVRGRAPATRDRRERALILQLDRVRLALRINGEIGRVEIEKGMLTLVPDAETTWFPAEAVPWMDGLDRISGLGLGMEPVRPRTGNELRPVTSMLDTLPGGLLKRQVLVRDMDVFWRDGVGEELCVLRGCSMELTPVELPRRALAHVHLQAQSVRRHDGQAFRNVVVERMLSADDEWTLAEAYGGGGRPAPSEPISFERLRMAGLPVPSPATVLSPTSAPPVNPEALVPILPPEVSPAPGD